MNETNAYRGLRFDRQTQRLSPRIIAVAVAIAIYTAIWWLIPSNILYWLFLLPVVILVWMASYGWRKSISELIRFLKTIEHMTGEDSNEYSNF